jgi:hypothetical protein
MGIVLLAARAMPRSIHAVGGIESVTPLLWVSVQVQKIYRVIGSNGIVEPFRRFFARKRAGGL